MLDPGIYETVFDLAIGVIFQAHENKAASNYYEISCGCTKSTLRHLSRQEPPKLDFDFKE